MSYKDEYHPAFKKDLKRLDKKLITEVFDKHIDKILKEPYLGEELRGKLTGVFSYHFIANRVGYRIAYFIDTNKKFLYFVVVGKRENFYEILKRRLSG